VDSRLQRVGGTRLVHLRYGDAPRVARAIVDAEYKKARVYSRLVKDTPYVEIVRDGYYCVVIRGDDWKRIFPFLRYSDNSYQPVTPPLNEPPPVPSPQPNRVLPTPPVNPSGGLVSFLDGFPFSEYSKIQKLLTTTTVSRTDAPIGPGVSLSGTPLDGESVFLVATQQQDVFDFRQNALYAKLVPLLQKLFPTDFPTRF
jgi:hypothetical protein